MANATRCTACGSDFADRDRVNLLLDTESNLRGFCWLITLLCMGMTFAWFNAEKDRVLELGILGSVVIGVVVTCLFVAFRVWRNLKQDGRPHPKRRSVLLYMVVFSWQLILLGFFQLVATLVLWRM